MEARPMPPELAKKFAELEPLARVFFSENGKRIPANLSALLLTDCK
jgi:hypothetical protein